MAIISIREVLNKVGNGILRIPKFQRGFVWDPDSIAFLMDSIYKDYPFGTIQLWRTTEPLTSERKFGPFNLFEREDQYPIDYVLDGQQRITSIFGVFQTEIEVDETEENPFSIYFDFSATESEQESQFQYLESHEVEPHKHFPLSCLFDTVKYRQKTSDLTDSQILIIDALQEKFKEAQVPFQILETDDRAKVAIVFERINRKGVPLDTFQLLTAWTWSDAFDLQEKFDDLQDELSPFGFSALGENTELLLRISSAILTNDITPKALIDLNGGQVREAFPKILNGIRGAIDFLKSEMKIEKLINLPYDHLLTVLTVFFAIDDNKQLQMTSQQREIIIKWFWKSLFSKRYSSSTRKNTNRDIVEILKLKNNKPSRLDNFTVNLQATFFTENKFSMRNVNTKTFILMLAQLEPRSFISGNKVGLGNVLKNYNKREFHHIVPKSYVSTLNNLSFDVNCLANFCILSRTDNNQLGGFKPSVYKTKMPSDTLELLNSAACDKILFTDDFDNFIISRQLILLNIAKSLMEKAST